jgi:excisionase family DNA binding protein
VVQAALTLPRLRLSHLRGSADAVSHLRVLDPQDRRPFYTVKTLALRLAVSERTVRQMLADRKIASYMIEGQRRVDEPDLDAYLSRNRTEANRAA